MTNDFGQRVASIQTYRKLLLKWIFKVEETEDRQLSDEMPQLFVGLF